MSFKNFRTYIIILFLLGLSACGGSSSSGGDSGQTGELVSILVLGDSIAVGENRFGTTVPWPTILGADLNVPVDNQSVSGVESSFGLNVIEDLLSANQPSHVIIMLGTNDAISGSVSAAIGNLQAMVDIANDNNVVAVVATLPVITNSEVNNNNTAEISDAIRNLSGATIADVRDLFGSDGAGLLIDGLHPNDAGQQAIASTIASVL